MEAEQIHQQLTPSAFRALQPQGAQSIHHSQQHLGHIQTQTTLDLSSLEGADAVFSQDLRLQDPNEHAHAFQTLNPFDRSPGGHRSLQVQDNGSPHSHPHNSHQQSVVNQFGILPTTPIQHGGLGGLQDEEDFLGSAAVGDQKGSADLDYEFVQDPPNLSEWRQKLFDVNDIITLSEQEYKTYFPHVDNVYSHRSTQKYKRKPFISHYWDCRLKGRPPGTPKSDDPNKMKRKRTARKRDLCDVKIKITEYFPGAMLQPGFVPDGDQADAVQGNNFFSQSSPDHSLHQQQFGMPLVNPTLSSTHPGIHGAPFYTIQRVNGNGGNGKGDGVAGPHKHTLLESDRIKKNSVQRFFLKRNKEEKKTLKTYHKKASGNALATVRKRSKEIDLKLFGSCFCPFVQRVWIALEAKGMPYQYIEVDPYKKPEALLAVNPRGLVPALRHGIWGCGESTVIMEYLEDIGGVALLPQGDAQLRATCRLWSDHINRNIVPAFYHLLQAQDLGKQIEYTKKLQDEIKRLVEVSDPRGPFFLGERLSYVDVQFAPWMIRFSRVLKPYRAWPDPLPGSRWARWLEAVETNEQVQSTTSMDELYIDSYERYAQNRPDTSELADAINGGYGLP